MKETGGIVEAEEAKESLYPSLIPTEFEIRNGLITDIYFSRAEGVLSAENMDQRVVMEIYATSFPENYNFAAACGVYDALRILEGKPVNVRAVDEGEVFFTSSDIYEPIVQIEGKYRDFVEYESVLLGSLKKTSGISTRAARMRIAAGDKEIINFGLRSCHPSFSLVADYASYIGGVDGLSNIASAKRMGLKAKGTMPHALMQMYGDPVKAWEAFQRTYPEVPLSILGDTFYDPQTEAIMALEKFGKNLYSVRIDSPSSRRGDFKKIAKEVRHALDIRGGEHVKIVLSGGLDEYDINNLREVGDVFGIGTSIVEAPIIDYKQKIVWIEGERTLVEKVGGYGGKKHVYRKWTEGGPEDVVAVERFKTPDLKELKKLELAGYEPLLKSYIIDGKIVRDFEHPQKLRERVLKTLERLGGYRELERKVESPVLKKII